MRATYGIFKENYMSRAIFWRGTYNINGDGEFKTIKEARAQVDLDIERDALQLRQLKFDLVMSGAGIKAFRFALPVGQTGLSADMITVYFPDGTRTMSMREYRQNVFDFEEKYDKDIVIL